MLSQSSVIVLKLGLKSQRGPLTQKIPPSNSSAAGILGPDLVRFIEHNGCTDLEGLCGLPDDPAGVGGRGLGRRAQAPLPLVLLLLHALPHQSEKKYWGCCESNYYHKFCEVQSGIVISIYQFNFI